MLDMSVKVSCVRIDTGVFSTSLEISLAGYVSPKISERYIWDLVNICWESERARRASSSVVVEPFSGVGTEKMDKRT
jgi:hypothetical protein